jgi:hypothetical protein
MSAAASRLSEDQRANAGQPVRQRVGGPHPAGDSTTAHVPNTPEAPGSRSCPRVSTARRRATLRIEALEAEWVLRHALARWLDIVEACRRANAADCARNPQRVALWVQEQVAHLARPVKPTGRVAQRTGGVAKGTPTRSRWVRCDRCGYGFARSRRRPGARCGNLSYVWDAGLDPRYAEPCPGPCVPESEAT